MKIKTVRVKYASTYHTYMLQVNGTTLQNIERVTRNGETIYEGDYPLCYRTIKEAKEHTTKLASIGRFGEIFQDLANA